MLNDYLRSSAEATLAQGLLKRDISAPASQGEDEALKRSKNWQGYRELEETSATRSTRWRGPDTDRTAPTGEGHYPNSEPP